MNSIKTAVDKKGNIIWSIKYVADKTGEHNEAPLNKTCLEIVERWKDKKLVAQRKGPHGETIYNYDCLLPYLSDSMCNRILHKILRKIGLREMREFHRTGIDLDQKEQFGFWEKVLRVRFVGKKRK